MDIPPPPHPHRTTSTSSSTTSELFICFTSRLSHSSSMRLTSKSILSPGRDNNTNNNNSKPGGGGSTHSLSSSLSRRLKHNGSLRGAQSPAMLKVKSSRGFEAANNAEPSSPKVTCIGQVRVKTKKQGKKMMKMKNMRAAASCRSNSKRLIGTDNSFRRLEDNQQASNNNQIQYHVNNGGSNNDKKWVHIPMTICEALRTFGAEFSCLLPCKSSCFSSSCNNSEGGEKRVGEEREGSGGGGGGGSATSTSCGAVFRWLLALEEEEEGKGRDIELVVEERGEREGRERVECSGGGGSSRRRSIFDDMDFQDEIFKDGGGRVGEGDGVSGGGRVSVCVPPKNALLLMRCRSDPVKMASLSHKIWDSGNNDAAAVVVDEKDSDDEEEKGGDIMEVEKVADVCSPEEVQKGEDDLDMMVVVVGPSHESCDDLVEGEKIVEKEEELEGNLEKEGENKEELEIVSDVVKDEEMEKEIMMDANEELEGCSDEEEIVLVDEDKAEGEEEGEKEKEEDLEERKETVEEDLERERSLEGQESSHHSQVSSSSSCSSSSDNSSAEEQSTADSDEDKKGSPEERDVKSMSIEEEKQETKQEKERSQPKAEDPDVLPDCLLLMMCEPKLSMEVSKETWVCSTDFIKWLPDRHQMKKGNSNNKDEPVAAKAKPVAKKKDRINMLPAVHESFSQFTQQEVVQGFQPARSSISVPVASLIEKKLMKAGVGYEPFVLTRCKSAPHRSGVAAKIAPPMPEMGCGAWRRENGRQLEPHRPASAAGVGF